jgi:hypothetical protein
MTQVLYPIGDGIFVGDWKSIGGIEKSYVMNPLLGDDAYVYIKEGMVGNFFDVHVESKGPIEFGNSQLHVRANRIDGGNESQISASIWGENPQRTNSPRLISTIDPIFITFEDWNDYVKVIEGRDSDYISSYMGDLWIRIWISAIINGSGFYPKIGISSVWIETPESPKVVFNDLSTKPTEGILVYVRTYSGRTGVAKYYKGEWLDESDQPFEKMENGSGPDGRLNFPIAVNGWSYM